MPSAQAIAIVTYSMLVHGWDGATALGPAVEFDGAEAALAEAVGVHIVLALRPQGLFQPEVLVASTSTPTEKIVGFSGRSPH
jgi:uncharacterized protein (TIGR03086 family)